MSNVIKLETTSPRVQLRGAQQRGELVRVWRGNLEDGSFCGYLAGIGKEWLLLWVVGDQISFDGLYAMRLADITQVVRATADHAAVMGVHVDTEDENEVCYIGRLLSIEDDGFTLQEITPDAEWLREPSFFGWDEVSTVSFDEPYAQVLLDVAGQPPRIDFTGSGFGSPH